MSTSSATRAAPAGARFAGLVTAAVMLASSASSALAAQPPVGLGTADSYAVLAGQSVTNTGSTTINGDLGVNPGTAATGFTGPPDGTVHGTVHAGDAASGQAQTDLATAYNDAASRLPPISVPGGLLDGLTLTPGVYNYASGLSLTGDLTLDAQGDPHAVFIFQAGSTLTTAVGSHVRFVNGAQPCNVFWQVGSSATLGTSSVFSGTILAQTSISMGDSVTVDGRALASTGSVTLINDTVTTAHCAPVGGGGSGGTGGSGGSGGSGSGGSGTPPGGTHAGTASFTTVPLSVEHTVKRFGTGRDVPRRFRIVIGGRLIRRVVFRLGGHVIPTRGHSTFWALVGASGGVQTLTARVTFTDSTRAVTLRLRFRTHPAAKRRAVRHRGSPSRAPRGGGGFTG